MTLLGVYIDKCNKYIDIADIFGYEIYLKYYEENSLFDVAIWSKFHLQCMKPKWLKSVFLEWCLSRDDGLY